MNEHRRSSTTGSLMMAEGASCDFDVLETPAIAESEPRTSDGLIYPALKQLGDLVGALLLLLPCFPIIMLAAAATKLTSPGPAFYWQTRLGRHGRPYRICKIRTMVHNAEAVTGAVWSQAHDPRVTPLGRFLRRSHIDEFPQLFQVIAGHMSLIGPRPERPEFVRRLQWDVPNYLERMQVKPGVTGLAQLVLPPDTELEDVRRKVQCDLYYIDHCSLWLDLTIGLHTAWLLIKSIAQTASAPFRLPSTHDVERFVSQRPATDNNQSISLGTETF